MSIQSLSENLDLIVKYKDVFQAKQQVINAIAFLKREIEKLETHKDYNTKAILSEKTEIENIKTWIENIEK